MQIFTAIVLTLMAAVCMQFAAAAQASATQERQLVMQQTSLSSAPHHGLGHLQAQGLRELASSGIFAVDSCAGASHTCVIDSSGEVRCWGNGSNGRLGYDSTARVGDDSARAIADAGTVNMGQGVTANRVAKFLPLPTIW